MIPTRRRVEGWNARLPRSRLLDRADARLPLLFADPDRSPLDRYKLLFDYLLAGFLEFRTPSGERAYYPGFKGMRGHRIEGLEGFARTVPLFASWLASGRGEQVIDPRTSAPVDLADLIRGGLLAGTDPAAPTYWGEIGDMDQRLVEAADIALILWLTRASIWAHFTPAERQQIADWLRPVAVREVSPNNWLLFQVLVVETLIALGMPADSDASQAAWAAFKGLYRGSGWFYDPPMGIDFYNSWGISYALYWIDQVSPALDHQFIREALSASAELTLHLITAEGLPIMGRSIPYRMAMPSPVLIQSHLDPDRLDPGLARRALDAVWLYFVRHGALAQGCATQGYHRADKRLLDRYSGPASGQWSLRSLVLAFLHPDDAPFWTAPEKRLPVEVANYRREYPELGWVVGGDKAAGEVSITIPANPERENASLQPHGAWRKAVERLFHKPHQPHNYHVRYWRRRYSSRRPIA
ncbi:DUF2264 domain-containing protein [uncultured Sphingomonas sp.]|uniref:DUF2264 domain-containing protein n=1 Tax=uncultured Sphingomonas sp. TaxID=158754 RepID=UPI0025DF480A|nr:DUF2264 domain-containing protein [uncultured Sphingomonas sp.]